LLILLKSCLLDNKPMFTIHGSTIPNP
jgi:hypothetical protein